MSVRFDCKDIDNDAIHIVIDLLLPYLKYDPDSEYRVLDLEKEDIEDKHLTLYEEIFVPYMVESKKHFQCHHYGGCVFPDSWHGEQACLSMIHAINQKAWWLLYFFAIKDAMNSYCKIPQESQDVVTSRITSLVLDGGVNIEDAIVTCIDESWKPRSKNKEPKQDLIIQKITQSIKVYKEVPSHPMVYR